MIFFNLYIVIEIHENESVKLLTSFKGDRQEGHKSGVFEWRLYKILERSQKLYEFLINNVFTFEKEKGIFTQNISNIDTSNLHSSYQVGHYEFINQVINQYSVYSYMLLYYGNNDYEPIGWHVKGVLKNIYPDSLYLNGLGSDHKIGSGIEDYVINNIKKYVK